MSRPTKWRAWGLIVNDIPWPCWTCDERDRLEREVRSRGLPLDHTVRIVRVEVREVRRAKTKRRK